MYRSTLLVAVLLIFCIPSSAQTTNNDSQTLQAILLEVRQLRQNLQTTTLALQSAQVLLRHWQVQGETVSAVSQRLNDVRSRLSEAQDRKKHFADELTNTEAYQDQSQNDVEKKRFENEINRLKSNLDSAASDEQECQTRKMEAEEQLRIEQSKLSNLEDQLDRLEKSTEKPISQ
jgi:hypothetical protein